jgi:hypothetical protein
MAEKALNWVYLDHEDRLVLFHHLYRNHWLW